MASLTFLVTDQDTAVALGSGDLPILGTPRLLAWMEAATLAVDGATRSASTSVGTRAQIEHLAPAPVGARVTVQADLTHLDGRLSRFTVAAHDESGRLLATASITRVVVDRDRFEARLRPEPG